MEKKYYETIGQGLLFGHDNLRFKTVNLPKKQRLTNLCKKFSIKQIDLLYGSSNFIKLNRKLATLNI